MVPVAQNVQPIWHPTFCNKQTDYLSSLHTALNGQLTFVQENPKQDGPSAFKCMVNRLAVIGQYDPDYSVNREWQTDNIQLATGHLKLEMRHKK